jgi:DNA-binding CsgD family transcriptional regulator/PAS domain-containing protein
MKASLTAISGLLALLYEGLTSPERWNDFLAKLCDLLDCQAAAITLHDRQNQNPTVSFSFGFPPEVLHAWSHYYGARNPRARPALRAIRRTGAFLSTASLASAPRALLIRAKETGYYDFCSRYELHHSAIAGVPALTDTTAALSLVRTQRQRPFGRDALDLLSLLTPHFQRAMRFRQKLDSWHALGEAGKLALDCLDTAFLATDGHGRVLLLNRQAETILNRERGIALRKGKLTAIDSSDARRLRLLLRSATLADLAPDIAGIDTMALQHDETSKPLYLTIMPARGRDVPSRGRPGALVFISDPATEPASRMPLLSRLFGLTPAECRLVALLLQNVELRAAAQHMHVTTGTARFMLKSIFYKTHCHRQAELIRLVSMIPGIPPQPKSSSRERDEADRNAKVDAQGAAS